MTTAAQRIWEAIYAAEFVREYHSESHDFALWRTRAMEAHESAHMVAHDALEDGVEVRMPVAATVAQIKPASRFRRRSR